ncbi:hypothetical protein L1987_80874 [Smallanthus sonchifolius]|uniref:Uncharacterized protein n=1 Tax=Smallanthus sonchifolius TaxID=185202 RepID=A0ACB8YPK7_9ASTR|nr:hypothetical protein L1987_80874 [Smallanthus sonchifolius]
MVGFEDIEFGAESSSLGSSCDNDDGSNNDNDDGQDRDGVNVNANVMLYDKGRRMTKDVQPEPPIVLISEDSSRAKSVKVVSEDSPSKAKVTQEAEATPTVVQDPVISMSTPRKKSIPKRVLRKQADVIIHRKDKYKKLYESEHVDDLTDRQRFGKNVREGYERKELHENELEKEKTVPKDKEVVNEKEKPIEVVTDYYKSNFPKDEEAKTLSLIEEFVAKGYKAESIKVCNKALALKMKRKVEENQVLREKLSELEKSKKRRLEVAEASIKASEESMATWFKKSPESSSRIMDSFEAGIENFSARIITLTNEDIISLAAMRIAYMPENEFYARDFANIPTKLSMDLRGIEYDNTQTFVLYHQLGGRL